MQWRSKLLLKLAYQVRGSVVGRFDKTMLNVEQRASLKIAGGATRIIEVSERQESPTGATRIIKISQRQKSTTMLLAFKICLSNYLVLIVLCFISVLLTSSRSRGGRVVMVLWYWTKSLVLPKTLSLIKKNPKAKCDDFLT